MPDKLFDLIQTFVGRFIFSLKPYQTSAFALIGRGILMNIIQYKFCDGSTSAVEVTDDIYEVHLYLLQQEKRLHWREAKHNVS